MLSKVGFKSSKPPKNILSLGFVFFLEIGVMTFTELPSSSLDFLGSLKPWVFGISPLGIHEFHGSKALEGYQPQ